jgi:hypothetical protein
LIPPSLLGVMCDLPSPQDSCVESTGVSVLRTEASPQGFSRY